MQLYYFFPLIIITFHISHKTILLYFLKVYTKIIVHKQTKIILNKIHKNAMTYQFNTSKYTMDNIFLR